VAAVQKTLRKTNDLTCRRCQARPETLGHVLNACAPNTGLMRERHNTILQRLARAIPREENDVYLEKLFSPEGLRPDVVVINKVTKDSTIVDV